MRSWVAPTPNEEECIRHIPKRMLLLPFSAVCGILLFKGGWGYQVGKNAPPYLIDKEKGPFCFGHGEGRRGRIRIIHKNLFAEPKSQSGLDAIGRPRQFGADDEQVSQRGGGEIWARWRRRAFVIKMLPSSPGRAAT